MNTAVRLSSVGAFNILYSFSRFGSTLNAVTPPCSRYSGSGLPLVSAMSLNTSKASACLFLVTRKWGVSFRNLIKKQTCFYKDLQSSRNHSFENPKLFSNTSVHRMLQERDGSYEIHTGIESLHKYRLAQKW